jgi:glutamate-5-semialdehyde dehydrogenase
LKETLEKLGQSARAATRILATAPSQQKNRALQEIACSLLENQAHILAANQRDVEKARQQGKPAAFLERLALQVKGVKAMIDGLKVVAGLPDPVGRVLAQWTRPNGLRISRVSMPLGVVGVIYESRPNVTIDAAALCLKAGNAVILRGGSESFATAQSLMKCIEAGIAAAGLPAASVQMVPTADRAAIDELLQLDRYIDVIVPRGGPALIEHARRVSRVPLFQHLAGNCHTYVQAAADVDMAKTVLLNAKMRRTGICGSTETLLIDRAAVATILPQLIAALTQAHCEIRGDQEVKALFPTVKAAVDADWDTEFLDAIIAIKIVADIDEAIAHIAAHGTQHTEAIITEDTAAAEKFLREVDSAIVMHNASTQFADGGEFGMGAEIGIATGKLHARGPVGVEQLTTFKYQVRGSGQIRST